MKLHSTLSAASLSLCVVTGLAATASADQPSAEPAPTLAAHVVGDSVVAKTDHALFVPSADGKSVDVRAGDSQPILTLPAAFLLDGQQHPLRYQVMADGHALILTPETGLRSVASPMEDQLALNDFATDMTRVPLGSIAGALLGALVGTVIGLGSCLVVGPACLATAPAAIGAFAGAGGVLGTLLAGGAALADGLWKYLTTVQAAPGQSAYAGQGGVLDPNGTGVPDSVLRMPQMGSGSSGVSGSSSGGGH
ncbi:hypothetical protein ACFYUD_11675 [Nocardia tengchongensis]|uniref:hypothetical protein n=1 Tax=Nocardia tengchongensis TaxID=2055889 RepID=UPI00367C0053